MSKQLETLVAEADWPGAEQIARRLPDAIRELPRKDQRAALTMLLDSTRALTLSVKAAQSDVGAKLCTLRRGQAAKEAYRA